MIRISQATRSLALAHNLEPLHRLRSGRRISRWPKRNQRCSAESQNLADTIAEVRHGSVANATRPARPTLELVALTTIIAFVVAAGTMWALTIVDLMNLLFERLLVRF